MKIIVSFSLFLSCKVHMLKINGIRIERTEDLTRSIKHLNNTILSWAWDLWRRETKVQTQAINLWCWPFYDRGSRGDRWHRGVCVAAGPNSTAAFTTQTDHCVANYSGPLSSVTSVAPCDLPPPTRHTATDPPPNPCIWGRLARRVTKVKVFD